jgi:mRNA interferase RelE/StbE
LAWTVSFTATAERQLGKLDRPVQRRILNILDQISQGNPRDRGKPMQGDRHAWVYRVGEWRIICDLVDSEKVIYVVMLGHRREVYR